VNTPYTELKDTVRRLLRSVIRCHRKVNELRDKTNEQMTIIYEIVNAQNAEIAELKAGSNRQVAGSIPALGSIPHDHSMMIPRKSILHPRKSILQR
jgi:hypothetical protein